jgi:intracellular septation protein
MSTPAPEASPKPEQVNPLLKLALEFGPLGIFFFTNSYGDRWFGVASDQRIFLATGVFIAASLVSLVLSKLLLNHLPRMAIVNAVVVTVFGGLTLALHDELFIKLKPSIVNSLFGTILLVGLWLGRPLLPYVLDSVMSLTDEGWRKLTFRWGWFFFVLAGLNEVVWRNFSTDFWVGFKVWGIMPITLAFALAQTPLILKHEVKEGNSE